MIGVLAAAEIRQVLQDAGIPITDVFTPFESQVIWAAIRIDTGKLREMHTTPVSFRKQIGDLIFNNKVGYTIHRLILVGDDIDVYSFKDVIFAYATRCRPEVDETFYADCMGFPLVPFMSHGSASKDTGGKCVSDALLPGVYTKPPDWELADFKNSYSTELQQSVLQRWEAWGFHA